ncbi:MAG: efflux RND transporter periplasmic adaptor subunit [Limnothrix sp. RL_2_0]|nr:efflux RND transporter periplasmic adaptor subunit [Limnothrix sp. RL_2_0]
MTQLAPKPTSSESDSESGQMPTPQKSRGFAWKSLVLGLVIGAIASGVAGKITGSGDGKTPTAAVEEVAPKPPGRAITVMTVESQAIAKTLETVGTVAASDLISVTSPRTGLQITNLLVEEGDFVQAGQTLAQLNNDILRAELLQAQAQSTQATARLAELKSGARPEEVARAKEQRTQAEAAVERAEADLKLAQQRLDRNQGLLSEGAIARDTLDETRNRRDSAQASLLQNQASLREAQQRLTELQRGTRAEVITQAQAQLDQAQAQVNLVTTRLQETRIVAPRAGKVLEKFAQVGDLTSSSDPLFSIVEAGQLELLAKIPETQLDQIQVGQAVTITADSDANLQVTGTVREIVPTVDQQSRQATLKIELPANKNLKPGMLLRAQIVTGQAAGLAVPTAAVIPQDGESATAFLLQPDNTVIATTVTLGELLDNNQVEILSGVEVGDRLVMNGAAYLKDGDSVEVVAPI